ncbi:hypothetical protein TNCV_1244871 [Trichonephila clavipes]|nr:hypothetical protein TNCV_1244871 [Trichonephila clavipes]
MLRVPELENHQVSHGDLHRMPIRHWGTLHRRRGTSPLLRLVEEEDRWEALDHSQGFSFKIGVEPRQTVLSPA